MAGRRLGQHFLAPSILERIASAACPYPDQAVIEIGPGKGALTEYLVQIALASPRDRARSGTGPLPSGEISRSTTNFRFNTPMFSRLISANGGRFRWRAICRTTSRRRSSSMFLRWARICCTPCFSSRRRSPTGSSRSPGSRDYGYLSVQVQVFAEPKYLLTVPPGRLPAAAESRFRCCRTDPSAAPRSPPIRQGLLEFAGFASVKSERCCGIISPAHTRTKRSTRSPRPGCAPNNSPLSSWRIYGIVY